MSKIKEISLTDVVNEDGTSLEDFPKNPLLEKWIEKYSCKDSSTGTEDVGDYGCILCGKNCPFNEYWIVPDEDLEEYKKYTKCVQEYHKIHNPKLYEMILGGNS